MGFLVASLFVVIQDIVMYNPSDMWILVIIHFMDGSERWGTIKKGKYCRSQSGQEKIYTFEEFNDIAAIRRAKALLLGPRASKCSL